MSDANAFTAESEKIELRLDRSNAAAVVTNLCGVLRTDLADYMETLASSLKGCGEPAGRGEAAVLTI